MTQSARTADAVNDGSTAMNQEQHEYHSLIRSLKQRWDDEDSTRDELERRAKELFLEDEANQIARRPGEAVPEKFGTQTLPTLDFFERPCGGAGTKEKAPPKEGRDQHLGTRGTACLLVA